MTTRRPRITFAGWKLGDYGGMETRVVAATDLAAAEGFDVSVRIARPLRDGSITQRGLADHDVRSTMTDWSMRPVVRLSRSVGRVLSSARRRRRLTDAEASAFGHRWAMSEIERYWEGAGRRLLEQTDLLHLFGPPLPFVVNALNAAVEAGVPSVYQSVHAVDAEYASNVWRRGFAGVCNELDLLLVSHAQQEAEFREHFGYRGSVSELSQWAYGVEDELLAIDRPQHRPGDPVIVGALCRMDPVKGLDTLIRAFAALPRDLPVKLRVGGDGPQEAQLLSLRDELHLADRVEFIGFVEDRLRFFESIDAFAITSQAEGGPVTGVEAMAAGLPIVSTDVGAMRQRLAGGVGVLVRVGDVDGVASAVQSLATDASARVDMGSAARARYVAEFSAAQNSSRLRAIWSDLAGLGSAAAPTQSTHML